MPQGNLSLCTATIGPLHTRAGALQQKSHRNEKPAHLNRTAATFTQLEKARTETKAQHSQKYMHKYFKKV